MKMYRPRPVGLALLIGLGFAAPAAASRWHDGPFSPTGEAVDHVVVMEIHKTNPDRDVVRTISRHGHWALSEERAGETTWFNFDSRTSARRTRTAEGEQVTVGKEDDALYLEQFDLQPRQTDRTDRLLGETCRVWEVWRTIIRGPKDTVTRHESCVTPDGIELWYRTTGGWTGESGRATSVVRRRLRDADVMPPKDLLARARFLAAARRQAGGYVSPIPDHIVLYGTMDGSSEERRSGSWSAKMSGPRNARTLQLRDDASGAWLSVSRDYKSGALRDLNLFLPAVTVTAGRPVLPDKNGKSADLVLDEPCWSPPEPRAEDGEVIISGYASCLSADGILMSWSRAGRIYTAARATALVRRPVRFDEVFPRDTPLSNRAWGLTDHSSR